MTTKIEWTDETWNPVRGCSPVSEGCRNCYAARMASRFSGPGKPYEGLAKGREWTGKIRLVPQKLDEPFRWRKPRRIFVNSMSDLFHQDVPDEYIARVWQAMSITPHHVYQVLTKRADRMHSWTQRWYSGDISEPLASRPVLGYPGYSVTTQGVVFGKRADTAAGLQQDIGDQGHRRVRLYRENVPHGGQGELVHRLVLSAFARRPEPAEQVCHRNGDPSDNRLSNLYWGTQRDNWRDRLKHGNGRAYSKLTEEDIIAIRRRAAGGESAARIAVDYPVSDTQIRNIVSGAQWNTPPGQTPPPPPARAIVESIWLGVSAENQKAADERIPLLLKTPAALRFVSCEPLLGPVDLTCVAPHDDWWTDALDTPDPQYALDWVIVGGETGPGARPMHPDWVRSIRDQCRAAGVPFMFKQWGEWLPGHAGMRFAAKLREWPDGCVAARVGKKAAGRELDGREWLEFPVTRESSRVGKGSGLCR